MAALSWAPSSQDDRRSVKIYQDEDPAGSQARQVELERYGA